MKKLTKIEQLDAEFPGLADQVRQWFCHGISAEKVADLLLQQYQVSISPGTVGTFRCRRWVPEQNLFQKEKIAARAAAEVAREQAVKASMAAEFTGEVK